MKQTDNIVLIGMPASGKSTLGVLLAKRLGLDFVDMDIIIQTGEDKTLEEIISDKGVKGFLKVEEEYLYEADLEGRVVSTGGSAVYSEKAMKRAAGSGLIVYLEQGLDALKERLSSLDSRGVVRMPGQDIDSLYHERTPLYETYADITVRCNGLAPDRIVSEIADRIESLK
ncbi:MAG: shikimate kinase [Desulfarculaceae bacterium]|nr:shikimate kinase [Desulfarculaceae bacterium]